MGKREADAQPQTGAGLQPVFVQVPQLRGALLQQDQRFRAVATRYDKDPDNFLASVKLAALRVWLRAL
jgi:transposase